VECAEVQSGAPQFSGSDGIEIYDASVPLEIEVPTSTVLISKTIPTATMPDAVRRVSTGLAPAIPERNPDGLYERHQRYFPSIWAASRNGCGAASTSTWVEVGAGERILCRSVIKLSGPLNGTGALKNDGRGSQKCATT
jgi:hypothetical protein